MEWSRAALERGGRCRGLRATGGVRPWAIDSLLEDNTISLDDAASRQGRDVNLGVGTLMVALINNAAICGLICRKSNIRWPG